MKALCCNVWLTAGRSALHAGVRSALADFIRVAFSCAFAARAPANLSWRGLYLHCHTEKLECHMTRGWKTAIHWT